MVIRYYWGRLRYKLCYWLFKDVVLEALTEALHPEFGYVWIPPDGEGYKYMQQAHADGWRQAFDQILAGRKCASCAKRVFE